MIRYVRRLLIAVVLASTITTMGSAQAVPAAPAQAQGRPSTPLKVQVVISRYEGDKKVSSLPYILTVAANEGRVYLRMGSQVPVPQANGGFTYMNVGTNIDCSAASTDDGRFKVEVRVEDSSIMQAARGADLAPTLRNFSTSNAVVLRDGQTAQFIAAADKSTGEVVKVDVTLTVEK